MKLLRGAVIAGTVLDQGRPVAQVSVQARPVRVVNGVRESASSSGGSATTDDRGAYRIYGLPPGDYVISASARFLISSGSELRQITPDEIRWAQQQLQPSGVQAAGASAPSAAAPPPAQPVAYTPVFYPGTTDGARAAVVTIAAGQERAGVDFSVQFVSTAKIEGTVLGPDGAPPQNAQLNLVPRADASAMMDSLFLLDSMMMMSRPTVINGKFSLAGVKPGDYTLAARAAPRVNGAAPGSQPGAGRGGAPPPMTLWASADITVDGTDQSGIQLRLEPGMELSGRIAFEAATLQPPADLSRVSIRLSSAPSLTGVTVSINVPSAQVAADGSFTFEGVTPGRYFLSAGVPGGAPSPGAAWVVKSARVGDVEAVDVPFEVRPAQNISDVVITFTDKTSELSGTLFDAAGHPTPEFSVMLFSTDKAMWSQRSRRLRPPTRTGTDGKFKFTSLPPGEYFLAALTDFDPADYFKPEFLEQVAAAAMKVTIAEGEKKVQDLKIAGLPVPGRPGPLDARIGSRR